ncbi:hypothetical protein DAPPUDRAFT_335679 [Daphnia pulex]|uniref:Uncharacterized protein n=1 Tax=Daphnia pulex TaxID=6669 RepID=E9HYA5_DAPPU|nr:hypothetical protein DAPPUDRAFT_335679 [Daphnia pulex]|eukprot:EFX63271.1 hypothetical protein DAPPUDRAFT_335679 [Daphnia pulex]
MQNLEVHMTYLRFLTRGEVMNELLLKPNTPRFLLDRSMNEFFTVRSQVNYQASNTLQKVYLNSYMWDSAKSEVE